MVTLLLAAIIIGSVVWLSRLAASPPQRRFGRPVLWRLACLIGAVRIAAIWIGYAAYHDAGWLQGLGYLLTLTALPEIYLVRGVRTNDVAWLLSATAVLAASSLAWAGLLVWVGNRVRPRTEPR